MEVILEMCIRDRFNPILAANVNPKKNGIKSTAFVTTCFNKIAIPTQGSKLPTVNSVFIAIPSIGNVVLIASTTGTPNLHITTAGKKLQMI